MDTVVNNLSATPMPRMSESEHVLVARRKAVELCADILAGTQDVLVASHALSALRFQVDVGECDEDFIVFTAISSEIDALPVGEVRRHWAPAALAALEPEVQAARDWALPLAGPVCHSILQRFGRQHAGI